MASSGTYSFGPDFAEITARAFARCGRPAALIGGEDAAVARTSFDLLARQWDARGVNLWTQARIILHLDALVPRFTLPASVVDIRSAVYRTSTYPSGGLAVSNAGGTAANAFDPTATAPCTQTSANGRISYVFPSSTTIVQMAGVKMATTTTLSPVLETSDDGTTWTTIQTLPTQSYTAGTWFWFDVATPAQAQYFGFRETGGATLSVTQLGFNTNVVDRSINGIDSETYLGLPNKYGPGVTNQYWLDRQTTPVLTVYPPDQGGVSQVVYLAMLAIQDAGAAVNTPNIPPRWYKAVVTGMAAILAEEYAPSKVTALAALAEKDFQLVQMAERERGDFSLDVQFGEMLI